MAKKSSKRNRTTDVKSAAANDMTEQTLAPIISAEAPLVVEPRLTPEQIIENAEKAPVISALDAPVSARTAAIRRSQTGKFNRANLKVIGGQEAPKFYPWTWQQRDAFMAQDTPEAQAVKARYDSHMQSVKA